jgi:hypothetical protein
MKKGQFALEFVILVSFTIFFTAIFLVVIQKSYAQSQFIKEEEEIGQIMRIISTEVALADTAPVGYERRFYLPTEIYGEIYNVSSTDGWDVVFRYKGNTYVYFLDTQLDYYNCYNRPEGCLLGPGFNHIIKDRSNCPGGGSCLNLMLES